MGWLDRRLRRTRPPERDVEALVAPLEVPCLRLRPTEQPSGSWLGGIPAAAGGFVWPRRGGAPLAFLAQLDLAQLARVQPTSWLPAGGRLLVFYDAAEQPWGFRPEDRDGWRVLLVPAEAELASVEAPADLDPTLRWTRREVAPEAFRVPPGSDRAELVALGLSDREEDALADLLERRWGGEPEHQVGGYPDPIQGDEMELECELASHGIDCGRPEAYADPRVEALRSGAGEWRLLLQLDSDEALGWCWGDLGRLYLWVRESEAARGDFDGAWLVLQCT